MEVKVVCEVLGAVSAIILFVVLTFGSSTQLQTVLFLLCIQFRVLQQAGLSYINDPKQLVFTSNQGKVVNGVLNGKFDVGFVRTDQIERTKDADGNLVDKSLLKIIEPQPDLEIDGDPFPFESSTALYSEWNVASLSHVLDAVSQEVQTSLLALNSHAAVGAQLQACYTASNCTDSSLSTDCRDLCLETVDPEAYRRCDTSPRIALLAHEAKSNGKYTAWRSTLSYMELRNMQEETGFISKDPETGITRCVRSKEIYDAIVCPPSHFRRSEQEVAKACAVAGLECDEGFQCLCSPCVKAFDVDIFPSTTSTFTRDLRGCSKFAVCGTVEQGESISFDAIDNKKRDGFTITVNVLEGNNELIVQAQQGAVPYEHTFSFDAKNHRAGVVILEILANDEQIPESPLRIQIIERDCLSETGDEQTEPDELGNCVCLSGSVEVGGNCILQSVLLPSILVPLAVILAIGMFWYVDRKRRQADTVWSVSKEELQFDEPPEILGRGTFGLVLLAEYRGTLVAVKRVIPPKVGREDSQTLVTRNVIFGVASVEDNLLRNSNGDREATPAAGVDAMESGTVPRQSRNGSYFDFAYEDEAPHSRKRRYSAQRSSEDSCSLSPEDLAVINGAAGEECDGPGSRNSIGHQHSLGSNTADGENTNWRRVSFGNIPESEGEYSTTLSSRLVKRLSAARSEDTWANLGKEDVGTHSGVILNGFASGSTLSMGSQSGRHGIFKNSVGSSDNSSYSKLKADFIIEMRHLAKLRHPCITTVMGAVISRREEPMLVMEYMEYGSLYDLLHNDSMVIEGELVLPILRDIVQGVRFLHAASPQVIHGDMKAQNVLVDSKFRAKVADFGLSQKKQVGATGTPLWMAPELLRGESQNTAMSDVYSFGIILYEVYSRQDPYDGEDHGEVLRLVADPIVNKRPGLPKSCPLAVSSIMNDCLVASPEDRPSFEELDLRLKRLDVSNVEPGTMVNSLQRKKREQAERSESLLFEVFPQHVAEALRDGRKVEAESYDCVTVFFSDIVGYTTISSKLDSMKVSDMLDRLYFRFDAISHEHDVFKVDTIGDAYMAVTNLHTDQSDHAARMARFSVDVMQASNETLIDIDDPSKGYVQIRVGFHSGPIVANVVGTRCPKYTLFGDTVNTASRMESNSIACRIQCSDRSADLVRRQDSSIEVVSRGQIEVKGKGEMHTFWVNGASSTVAPLATNEQDAKVLE